MIDQKTRDKARRMREELNQIPNDELAVFIKLFLVAVECGIDPMESSTPKAKRGKTAAVTH
jgi:hypothetical protein